MATFASYDDFHAHVRRLVRRVAPKAEEGVSYGMPAWRVAGKPLLGLNATRSHVSVYPFSPQVVDAVRDRLTGFTVTKGGVHCTPEVPAPDDVIREMLRLRLAEIAG